MVEKKTTKDLLGACSVDLRGVGVGGCCWLVKKERKQKERRKVCVHECNVCYVCINKK